MPAPKIDDKKFAAYMARNKKPKKMTSTQKSLADISKRANENYKSEYQRHSQGLKDAKADMKVAKTNFDMVKAMNKKAHHSKALSKMNRMESNEWVCGKCNCDPCVCEGDIHEKLSVGDGMGAWIDDFKKSDAPQFKGKSDKERRDMAIAAYLSAKRGAKKESVDEKVITKKMQQRALSKVRAQPKDKVSLPKAPWEKNKKEDVTEIARSMTPMRDRFGKSKAEKEAEAKKNASKKEDTQKSADRKPENYVAPDGKMRVRMVPTKKQVRDEGYVSAAQRKAVWATRADGGKGHPDKKGKK